MAEFTAMAPFSALLLLPRTYRHLKSEKGVQAQIPPRTDLATNTLCFSGIFNRRRAAVRGSNFVGVGMPKHLPTKSKTLTHSMAAKMAEANGVEPIGDRIACHPPVLKITRRVMIRLELQPPPRFAF